MQENILICTVGGSYKPVLKAIENTQPAYICFICTGCDPETGQSGSETQITGKGKIISESSGAPCTLPNIPTLAGLAADQFGLLRVPADDIDEAFMEIMGAILRLKERFPGYGLIADYTGGTKTMTAALVTAVLESDDVTLQLVTGARPDLIRVANQTEYPIAASSERIRLQRAMEPYLNAWQRYAYDEAAEGLKTLTVSGNRELASRLNLACHLSRGFASWDRFDHKAALEALNLYRPRIGNTLGLHLKALAMLVEKEGARREPLQLYDLWLNARRRAHQGRYDDAVARVYRLLEWTAQWQLRMHLGIDTADIPAEKIPRDLKPGTNQQGRYQTGLYQSWQLLAHHLPDNAAARFFQDHGKEFLDHLKVRNGSILAHGYTPIDHVAWEKLNNWIEGKFLPVMKQLAKNDGGLGFDLDLLQLPQGIPPGS